MSYNRFKTKREAQEFCSGYPNSRLIKHKSAWLRVIYRDQQFYALGDHKMLYPVDYDLSVYRIEIEFDEGEDCNPENIVVILSKESLDGGDSNAIDSELIHERWQIDDAIAMLCKRNKLQVSDILEATDFTI